MMSEITDFTLFNVSIINPSTMEKIDQGEMRYKHAKDFLDRESESDTNSNVLLTYERYLYK